MARFPSARIPRKTGSVSGRRQFFRNEGASEAGAPGTKSELRVAKHRVAKKHPQPGRCGARSHWKFDTGQTVTCSDKKGHEGKHFNSFAMRSW